MGTRYDALLKKRDGLLRNLRNSGVAGVRSAGLTSVDGIEQFLVLVAPGVASRVPPNFEGVPITVRETGQAKA